MAHIEFYEEGAVSIVASVDNAVGIPAVDEFISIRGETWMVTQVTWALDHADDRQMRSLRANVTIQRT